MSRYAFQRDCRATEDSADGAGLADEGVCLAVLDDDLGPAILVGLAITTCPPRVMKVGVLGPARDRPYPGVP